MSGSLGQPGTLRLLSILAGLTAIGAQDQRRSQPQRPIFQHQVMVASLGTRTWAQTSSDDANEMQGLF